MPAWDDLDKLAMAKPRPDGRATVVATDERSRDTIDDTRALSTLVAIARVTRGVRALGEKRGVVVYSTRPNPPPFLVDAVTAAGGVVFDGSAERTSPRPLAASVQLDAAFCDLATIVRRRLRAPDFAGALDVVETGLRRKPTFDWTTMLELVALAGELVRTERFARWVLAPAQRMPFALDLGGGGLLHPGSLAQAICEGSGGSLRELVSLARVPAAPPPRVPDPANPVRAPEVAARWMPLLCDRRSVPLAKLAWDPLVDPEVDTETMPVVVWVEDRGAALRWPPAIDATAERRAAARRNIDELAVEVGSFDVNGTAIALVTGDFFAAETILAPTIMERVRMLLDNATSLLVGTPARGHLIAISAARALVDDDVMEAFLGAIEQEHLRAPERDRISSEVVVYTTRPLGRVQSNLYEARRALRDIGVDPDA